MVELNVDCDICKATQNNKELKLKDGQRLQACDFHLYTYGKTPRDFYNDHMKDSEKIEYYIKMNNRLMKIFYFLASILLFSSILNAILNLKR